MTKLVRYQNGGSYARHGAWYVTYRVPVRQENGSTKLKNKVKMLGSLKDYPREADILHLKTEFMLQINAGRFTLETNMTLSEFVEKVYLPYVEELRASTKKGYREIWINHISKRVGPIRMREFRTVDASRMARLSRRFAQRQPVDLEEFHKPTQDTSQRPSRSCDSTTGRNFE